MSSSISRTHFSVFLSSRKWKAQNQPTTRKSPTLLIATRAVTVSRREAEAQANQNTATRLDRRVMVDSSQLTSKSQIINREDSFKHFISSVRFHSRCPNGQKTERRKNQRTRFKLELQLTLMTLMQHQIKKQNAKLAVKSLQVCCET